MKKYGSSCVLKLLDTTSSEDFVSDYIDSPCSSSDSDFDSHDDGDCILSLSPQHTEISPEEFYERNVTLTADGAAKLEYSTRGQSCTPAWFTARRVRITASVAKDIAARKKADFTPLIRRLLSCQFRGNKATMYGRVNEDSALHAFLATVFTDPSLVEVLKPGLFVNSDEPWLGASPDAVLTIDGKQCLVEIKCPYAARDLIIDEALQRVKSFCLTGENSKAVILKKTHSYYYQVQIQLHVCKLEICYFVVWTPKDLAYLTIHKDADFLQTIIPKLKSFYFTHMLPALSSDCFL